MKAPFPWFGGKRDVTDLIWDRLGRPKQYIEPFCGSAAILLGSPAVASLEVVGDVNGFIANFWRCVRHKPDEVARWADYPVSHIDQCARHVWLMAQRARLEAELLDCDWPGDAKVAGWWLWGQCSWIGSGWCEWSGTDPDVSDAGRGIQAAGQIPHVGNAGRGIQAAGKIPHVGNVGPHMLTSSGDAALRWLRELSARLERVRVIHGDWDRCLNAHYGGADTAIFFDPPYKAFETLYATNSHRVADAVEAWCCDHATEHRIALCGHLGDYALDGWAVVPWTRKRLTYSGGTTTDKEAIWFSPTCLDPKRGQASLFGGAS